MISINVYGDPAPQGSKKFVGLRRGRAVLVESSKKVKPWRAAVTTAALDVGGSIKGPVKISIIFTIQRPKGLERTVIRHRWSGTRRTEKRLAGYTLPFKRSAGDIDKLCRSTLDGLVDAGVIEDDSRVVHLEAVKRFPPEPGERGPGEGGLIEPGAIIRICDVYGDGVFSIVQTDNSVRGLIARLRGR